MAGSSGHRDGFVEPYSAATPISTARSTSATSNLEKQPFVMSLAWDRGDFNGIDRGYIGLQCLEFASTDVVPGAPAAVPEPAALWLALVAMGWLAAHGRPG